MFLIAENQEKTILFFFFLDWLTFSPAGKGNFYKK